MIGHFLADAYPLERPGGLFLSIIGAAAALGGVWFRQRYVLLGLGAGMATLATVFSVTALTIGAPTPLQIGVLALAVMAEVLGLAWVSRTFWKHGERALTLGVLAIVGGHFIIMAPAFGPLVAALGLLCAGNALLGARASGYPLALLWCVDGLLKLAAGAAMYFAHLLPAFA